MVTAIVVVTVGNGGSAVSRVGVTGSSPQAVSTWASAAASDERSCRLAACAAPAVHPVPCHPSSVRPASVPAPPAAGPGRGRGAASRPRRVARCPIRRPTTLRPVTYPGAVAPVAHRPDRRRRGRASPRTSGATRTRRTALPRPRRVRLRRAPSTCSLRGSPPAAGGSWPGTSAGHGDSEHAALYSWEADLRDAVAVIVRHHRPAGARRRPLQGRRADDAARRLPAAPVQPPGEPRRPALAPPRARRRQPRPHPHAGRRAGRLARPPAARPPTPSAGRGRIDELARRRGG